MFVCPSPSPPLFCFFGVVACLLLMRWTSLFVPAGSSLCSRCLQSLRCPGVLPHLCVSSLLSFLPARPPLFLFCSVFMCNSRVRGEGGSGGRGDCNEGQLGGEGYVHPYVRVWSTLQMLSPAPLHHPPPLSLCDFALFFFVAASQLPPSSLDYAIHFKWLFYCSSPL